jgi:hypothetical protein
VPERTDSRRIQPSVLPALTFSQPPCLVTMSTAVPRFTLATTLEVDAAEA